MKKNILFCLLSLFTYLVSGVVSVKADDEIWAQTEKEDKASSDNEVIFTKKPTTHKNKREKGEASEESDEKEASVTKTSHSSKDAAKADDSKEDLPKQSHKDDDENDDEDASTESSHSTLKPEEHPMSHKLISEASKIWGTAKEYTNTTLIPAVQNMLTQASDGTKNVSQELAQVWENKILPVAKAVSTALGEKLVHFGQNKKEDSEDLEEDQEDSQEPTKKKASIESSKDSSFRT